MLVSLTNTARVSDAPKYCFLNEMEEKLYMTPIMTSTIRLLTSADESVRRSR